jgi:hypothetical protein
LLFNGTLHYQPNLDAIDVIIKKINPVLLSAIDFKYKILICGKGLPEAYDKLNKYKDSNIIYAGFVDDIRPYFTGADIFINPIIDGGGIKTKLVEALGYNMNVVTTANGAFGVPATITNNKMVIVDNNDWELFAKQIIIADTSAIISPVFFEHFYWKEIVKKAANAL